MMLNQVCIEVASQRKAINKQLVEELSKLVNKHPDQRFSQILRNYGFVKEKIMLIDNGMEDYIVWQDDFNLEPEYILKRVMEDIKEFDK